MCQGTALFAVIAAFADVSGGENTPHTRQPGIIYLTGHRVLRVFAYHTALEYNTLIGGVRVPQILSAGSSGIFTSGYLNNVGELNRPQDLVNITITTVTSPIYPTSLLHFGALKAGHDYYQNDCIPYEATAPWLSTPPFPQGEHNSNSYVAGLLDITGGVLATGSMSDFVNGQNPVPSAFFTSSSPCLP